jgi:hypothetical protein
MKRVFLLLILVAGVVACSAGMLWATPIVNITDPDPDYYFETSVSYSYYKNSGTWLFTAEGNNLGNPDRLQEVEEMVEGACGFDPSFELGFTEMILNPYDARSGTWETPTAPVGTIEFYAVKAGDGFAMYRVNPADYDGSYSTYDLYLAGYGSSNVGEGVALSHFTGYNPGSAPVPEPATLLLLGTGLVGLAGFGRKRLKK